MSVAVRQNSFTYNDKQWPGCGHPPWFCSRHGPEIINITLDPARKCRISGPARELLNQKLQFNKMIKLVSSKPEFEKECYKVSTGARRQIRIKARPGRTEGRLKPRLCQLSCKSVPCRAGRLRLLLDWANRVSSACLAGGQWFMNVKGTRLLKRSSQADI